MSGPEQFIALQWLQQHDRIGCEFRWSIVRGELELIYTKGRRRIRRTVPWDVVTCDRPIRLLEAMTDLMYFDIPTPKAVQ